MILLRVINIPTLYKVFMPSFTITRRNGETYEVLYDECDRELIESRTWFICMGHTGNPYVAGEFRQEDGKFKQMKLHKVIMNPPKGKEVDHISHNTLDNRRENLRICTRAENQRNRRRLVKGKYSDYRGVSQKTIHGTTYWTAQVCVNGKKIQRYLKTEFEAPIMYNKLALEHFKEFAILNDLTNTTETKVEVENNSEQSA